MAVHLMYSRESGQCDCTIPVRCLGKLAGEREIRRFVYFLSGD